jgi:hypothetical protein
MAIEQGLPALPSRISHGHSVPVSTWISGDLGATLHISGPSSDVETPDLVGFIQIAKRRAGNWMYCETLGGSTWPRSSLGVVDAGGILPRLLNSAMISVDDGSWLGAFGIGGNRKQVIKCVAGSGRISVGTSESTVEAFVVAIADEESAELHFLDLNGRESARLSIP